MKHRIPVTVAALTAATILMTAPAFAQGGAGVKGSANAAWKAPRGADGHADLSGTWTNATSVPVAPEGIGREGILYAGGDGGQR